MNISTNQNFSTALRVLMVVPQYPYPVLGGLERQSHELAKSLIGFGVEVQALSGKTQDNQGKNEQVEGVLVHRLPWTKKKWIRFITSPFYILSILFRERQSYDIIHLHQYSWFGLFVIISARLLKKPILTKLPNDGMYGLPGVAKSRLGWLKLAIFKRSDAVVAMTESSLNELSDIGFPTERVLFTPNGIKVFEEETKQKENCINNDLCRVVFVGALREQKGLHDLLFAWKKLVDNTNHNVSLELWGDGPLESELKLLCAELNISDSVNFRGYTNSVRRKLREMDIFVLASLGEGNSNAILEAMEAALPIVCTRVGGATMQVGQEGERYLVEVGDKEGLFRNILELVENSRQRKELGIAMHERILTHFDIQKIARTYIRAYQFLVEKKYNLIGNINNPKDFK